MKKGLFSGALAALINPPYLPTTYNFSAVGISIRDLQTRMVEAPLSGIVLGLIPITLAGLFVTAYPQYRRGDQLDVR